MQTDVPVPGFNLRSVVREVDVCRVCGVTTKASQDLHLQSVLQVTQDISILRMYENDNQLIR